MQGTLHICWKLRGGDVVWSLNRAPLLMLEVERRECHTYRVGIAWMSNHVWTALFVATNISKEIMWKKSLFASPILPIILEDQSGSGICYILLKFM